MTKLRPVVKSFIAFCAVVSFFSSVYAQNNFDKPEDKAAKAKSVVNRAIQKLGGERYLNVRTSIGEGRFSLLKDGQIVSFSSFVDVIVAPEKERTDFTERGSKTVQVNADGKGWMYQEHLEKLSDQKGPQLESFKRSLRSHYDYLLKGKWKDEAKLSYEGRRRASLGKRNDVLRLTFKDNFWVEYEFSDEGLPMKTKYERTNSDNKMITEENRYAQFIDEQGILTPFVVDHYTDDKHSFRVNYKSMIYNKKIPDKIFVKPGNPKKLRKKLKL
ncbi:MAG: hypothetical protein HKN25_18425 [Pyrinomonadaceae bacterium]|nr:hypothetical protein [Pyrinomonadaceae bacterium]